METGDDVEADVERRWQAVRDREVSAGTDLGRRVLSEAGFEERWRRAVLWALAHPASKGPTRAESTVRRKRKDAADRALREARGAEAAVQAARAAVREADRARLARAREKAGAARRLAEAREARRREIAEHAPRLETRPPKNAPSVHQTTNSIVCPHGLEKGSCAYCGRRIR